MGKKRSKTRHNIALVQRTGKRPILTDEILTDEISSVPVKEIKTIKKHISVKRSSIKMTSSQLAEFHKQMRNNTDE